MQFFVEMQGTKQVSTKFARMAQSASNFTPAWEAVLTRLFAIEASTFDSQGRRGGGSWKADSPEWLARKMRDGLDPRINHATLALRNSMTVRDAPGQILHITPQALYFGSDLPYAGVSQENRPFVKLTAGDRVAIRNLIRDQLMAAWRS